MIHLYDEVNHGKYATVRHFKFKDTANGIPLLSDYLKIAENRSFARSNPDYWVKERMGTVWNKQALTGIWRLGEEGFYFGDALRKRHLLIFYFFEQSLTVYFFNDYYTRLPLVVLLRIKEISKASL